MTKPKNTVDEDGWTRVSRQDRKAVEKSTELRASFQKEHEIKQGRRPPPRATSGSNRMRRPNLVTPWNRNLDIVDQLRERYKEIERKWLMSDSSRRLFTILERELLFSRAIVSSCVCFGTGTFCGFINDWIARQDVALVQIAVFKTVVDFIGLSNVHRSASMS